MTQTHQTQVSNQSTTNWRAFGVISLGTLVGPLDSAVNVAFPAITAHFGLPDAAIQWVIVSYVITYATLILLFGRLGDLFGHLAVFRAGLAISALAFLAGILAQSFEPLLVSRALQGVGAAMILSCSPALAASAFGETQRARAVGSYTAVLGIGMTIGPSLGGLLVAVWGWPAVFGFRLPVAVLALTLTFFIRLPEQTKSSGRFEGLRAIAQAALLCVGLVAISRMRNGLPSPIELTAYLATASMAAMMLVAVGRNRGRSGSELSPLQNPDLVLVMLMGIAVNLVGFALMLFVPYFLVRIAELPVSIAGVMLAVSPLGIVAGGYLSPRLAVRIGPKLTALAGAVLVMASTAWIGTWQPETPLAVICASAFLHGVGLGLYQAAQLDVSTAILAREDRGVAGSLVMLTRTLGVVMAASALTALFVTVQSASPDSLGDAAYLTAFRATFLAAAAGLAAVLALSLLRPALWFHRSNA